MTIMIVIFSEVTTKIFAINRPMLYVLKVARFFYVYTKLIKPIVKLINYISEKIIKKLGLSLVNDQSKTIKEEFEGAIHNWKSFWYGFSRREYEYRSHW